MKLIIPLKKQFTTHRAVFLHAAWLGQTSVHCPIFLTAASRRSLVRISVPVWGIILSEPLLIVDLVSRYLTNYLIKRMPIIDHRNFDIKKMPLLYVMRYYSKFPLTIPLSMVGYIRVTHPCAGRHPSSKLDCAAPRLACVRPAASVHPEPGSNSSLLISFEPSRELTSRFLGFVVTPSLIYARPSRVQLGFWLISLFNELFAFAGAKLKIISEPTKCFCVIFFPITPAPFLNGADCKDTASLFYFPNYF